MAIDILINHKKMNNSNISGDDEMNCHVARIAIQWIVCRDIPSNHCIHDTTSNSNWSAKSSLQKVKVQT
jgi:hypothetical protein